MKLSIGGIDAIFNELPAPRSSSPTTAEHRRRSISSSGESGKRTPTPSAPRPGSESSSAPHGPSRASSRPRLGALFQPPSRAMLQCSCGGDEAGWCHSDVNSPRELMNGLIKITAITSGRHHLFSLDKYSHFPLRRQHLCSTQRRRVSGQRGLGWKTICN